MERIGIYVLAALLGGYFGYCSSVTHGFLGWVIAFPGYIAIGFGVPAFFDLVRK